ncbi:MAG: bifunctional adenosylcobinamide kinase/adenosylcobinamide-phosphate guanylyltransferase [Anaerovoracaceae bacterium]
MNIFISGGCKNGKSYYAQKLAKEMSQSQDVPLYYLATMIPTDDEDKKRIERHIAERAGWGFETIEQGENICSALESGINCQGAFLLDSVTALLSNEMFKSNGEFDPFAGDKVEKELVEFAKKTGNTVFVSDYIYSDARRFDEYTEKYRKGLAQVDRALARVCDQVIEVSFGNIKKYK